MKKITLKKGVTVIAALILIIGAVVFTVSADELTHEIKVGLHYGSSAADSVNISASEAGYFVEVIGHSTEPIFVEAKNLTLTTSGTDLILTGNGSELVRTSGKTVLSVIPISEVSTINSKSYRGCYEFYVNDNKKIVVINVIDVNEYIKGVLPSEVYPSWNMEALKAMAVASRTYALHRTQSSSHASSGFDICTTTHCQVYSGTKKETDRTNDAINETYGLVVRYDGKLATTAYHSSSGGYTESSSGAWGGNQNGYPYLVSVFTPYEDYRNVPNGKWESIISVDSLKQYIPQSYHTKLKGNDIKVEYERSISGYIGKMTVSDENGNKVTLNTSGKVRSFFGSLVKSANFGIARTFIPSSTPKATLPLITATGELVMDGSTGFNYIDADGIHHTDGLDEVYVFDGQGFGHGVGMSQFGARCMADAGFTYDQILYTYYPGTIIEPYITVVEPEIPDDYLAEEVPDIGTATVENYPIPSDTPEENHPLVTENEPIQDIGGETPAYVENTNDASTDDTQDVIGSVTTEGLTVNSDVSLGEASSAAETVTAENTEIGSSTDLTE